MANVQLKEGEVTATIYGMVGCDSNSKLTVLFSCTIGCINYNTSLSFYFQSHMALDLVEYTVYDRMWWRESFSDLFELVRQDNCGILYNLGHRQPGRAIFCCLASMNFHPNNGD